MNGSGMGGVQAPSNIVQSLGDPLRLVLVRHALTDWNVQGRWQGHSDVPLNAVGEQQALTLGPRLAGFGFDAVFSSDLRRATRTAELAGFAPIQDARLREIHFGDFEGKTSQENMVNPSFARWLEQPETLRTPNGEGYLDLRGRVLDWASGLPVHGNIAVFAHGGTLQMLLSGLLGTPALAAPRLWTLRVTHASISVLERHNTPTGQAWMLERLNDTAHLDALAQDIPAGVV